MAEHVHIGRRHAEYFGHLSRPQSAFLGASTPGLVIVATGVASLTSFLGSATGQEAMKALAVFSLLIALVGTARLLVRNGHAINAGKAVLMLGLLSIVPIARIAFEVVPTFDRRDIVDGLAIVAPYYALPFAALGILSHLASTGVQPIRLMERPLLILAVITLILVWMGYFDLSASAAAGVYTIYNNVLIPLALVLFVSAPALKKMVGIIALGSIFTLAALQGSRSYLLFSTYILVLSVLLGGGNFSLKWFSVAFFIVFLIIGFPFIISLSYDSFSALPVFEKLRFESLLPDLQKFLSSGDFISIYFWEGNSRAGILLDAFADYRLGDFLWGSGVNATYDSFVTRTTIEIGYAQELFWLGAVTFIPALWYTAQAIASILLFRSARRSAIGQVFVAIAITRVLDGLILGMPAISLYMLIYWMAVMWLALKPKFRRQLFYSQLPQT